MPHTKIMVLKTKEILTGAILTALGILLIVLLFFLFSSKDDDSKRAHETYSSGVHTSSLTLGENELFLSVTVNDNRVCHAEITNLSEAVTTMYPLVSSSLDNINQQLENGVELSEIQVNDESKYTELLLLNAIDEAVANTDEGDK